MTQGTPGDVCRNRWLILIFNISRRRISVLGDPCEESIFLLRQCFRAATALILLFALTLFLYSPRGPPRSHLSVRTMRT
jgi:hypothetical protein